MRTPLGSIRASAEALAAGAVEQPALCERLLTGLIEQSQYLGRLTDDLLRLAAYEGGGLVLRRGNMSLTPLIEQAIRGFEARAAARSVTLARDLPASLPDVCADADRVLEILFNLLDNALAHTPPGGRICMRTESDVARGVVWIHTVDSGTGIPPQMLPHLFKRYWRSSEYGQAGSGANVGLGLSIVREIIRAHGGTITASNIPTGGADFAFCLPIAKSSTGPGVFPLA